MDHLNEIANFMWGIADDVLRGAIALAGTCNAKALGFFQASLMGTFENKLGLLREPEQRSVGT